MATALLETGSGSGSTPGSVAADNHALTRRIKKSAESFFMDAVDFTATGEKAPKQQAKKRFQSGDPCQIEAPPLAPQSRPRSPEKPDRSGCSTNSARPGRPATPATGTGTRRQRQST